MITRVFVVATVLVGLCVSGCAAGASEPSAVWGIELLPTKAPGPADLARLHGRGLNALVLDPARVGAADRERLAVLARRAGMVVAVPRRARASSFAGWCRGERRGPAQSCTALAGSPQAAVELARRNVADFVVVRLSGLGQLRFLQGVRARTHVLAIARPAARRLDRKAWARAVQQAAKDPTLDLAVSVGSASQPSLATYLSLLGAARGKQGKPSPGSANLWVDTTGGSCVRQATRGAWVDAQACSWNQAYQAARSGDLILVGAGSYGVVTIGPDNPALGAPATAQPAPGATVTLSSLTTSGDWLTVKNVTVATGSNHASGWFNTGSNISLDAVNVTGPWANVKLTGGSNVTWRNSGLGTPGNTAIRLCARGDGEPVELSNTSNLLFSNLDFYPFQPELGNPACGPDNNMHLETIRVWDGLNGWRMERSRFHRGDGSGSARVFFSKIAGADPTDITFVNNWFGDSSGTVSIYLTANSACSNYVFAYNAWEEAFIDHCSPKTSLKMVGNTGTQPNYLPCMGTANIRNLWVWNTAGSCGSDRWVTHPTNSLSALRYAADGYHLQSNSPAIDAGDTSECATLTGGVDIDGRPRTGTCDAGPDEYGN